MSNAKLTINYKLLKTKKIYKSFKTANISIIRQILKLPSAMEVQTMLFYGFAGAMDRTCECLRAMVEELEEAVYTFVSRERRISQNIMKVWCQVCRASDITSIVLSQTMLLLCTLQLNLYANWFVFILTLFWKITFLDL